LRVGRQRNLSAGMFEKRIHASLLFRESGLPWERTINPTFSRDWRRERFSSDREVPLGGCWWGAEKGADSKDEEPRRKLIHTHRWEQEYMHRRTAGGHLKEGALSSKKGRWRKGPFEPRPIKPETCRGKRSSHIARQGPGIVNLLHHSASLWGRGRSIKKKGLEGRLKYRLL